MGHVVHGRPKHGTTYQTPMLMIGIQPNEARIPRFHLGTALIRIGGAADDISLRAWSA
jgi:hypothetical protein